MPKQNTVTTLPDSTDDDAPIWNAENIAIEANLFDEDGNPDVRRAYYGLEKGLIPGRKVGRRWVSTRRQIRSIATS
jgi:hypothetical protein